MRVVTVAQMKQIEKLADANGVSYYQMMENAGTAAYHILRQRQHSLFKPRLSHPSSLVMTEELLISLPAAAMVRTVPTGVQAVGIFFLR